MNANHDLERRIADYYATEAPPRAPDWVLGSVLATIDTTPQRRAFVRLPRRFHDMNTYAKLAIAAVVVIAVGLVGLTFLRPSEGSSVGGPNASTSPSPSTRRSPTIIDPSPPPLAETFRSSINGLSISYPSGWSVNPADAPWTDQEPRFDSSAGDILYDPALTDHLFVWVGSQSLDGQAGDAWAAEGMSRPELGCGSTPEPITVDGADGVFCEGLALVSVGDRGYAFMLYTSSDDPSVPRVYDRAWFETVLESVQLQPQDAVDATPSASP